MAPDNIDKRIGSVTISLYELLLTNGVLQVLCAFFF